MSDSFIAGSDNVDLMMVAHQNFKKNGQTWIILDTSSCAIVLDISFSFLTAIIVKTDQSSKSCGIDT